MDNVVSKIKQPEPSVSINNAQTLDVQGKKYKVVRNNANVGVLSAPKTSRTPLRDWIELKRKENPYTIYKVQYNKHDIKGIDTIAGIGVVICGVISLLKMLIKK